MIKDRQDLIEQYAFNVVEDMDMDTVMCVARDRIEENLAEYTDEELYAEIENSGYEFLLEGN